MATVDTLASLQRPGDAEDVAWASVWRHMGKLVGQRHRLEREYVHIPDDALAETAEASARLQRALSDWLLTLRAIDRPDMRPDRFEE